MLWERTFLIFRKISEENICRRDDYSEVYKCTILKKAALKNSLNLQKKEALAQMFFCKSYEIFQSCFSAEHWREIA